MSPAARKLAAKHLLSPRLKLTPNDMGISHPTPKRTPTTRTPLVATPKASDCAKTMTSQPSSSGSVNNSSSLTENDNMTDNLLQINVVKRTRLKAKDFFIWSECWLCKYKLWFWNTENFVFLFLQQQQVFRQRFRHVSSKYKSNKYKILVELSL